MHHVNEKLKYLIKLRLTFYLLVQNTVDRSSPRSLNCELIRISVVDTSLGKSVSSIDFINNFKFETHSFTFELNFSMNFNEEE